MSTYLLRVHHASGISKLADAHGPKALQLSIVTLARSLAIWTSVLRFVLQRSTAGRDHDTR